MAKLSIIVAVYNSEKYLGKCINSILSQTFQDFELILIDDGSSDEKIIAIPLHDPSMNMYSDISDLPPHQFDEISHFHN